VTRTQRAVGSIAVLAIALVAACGLSVQGQADTDDGGPPGYDATADVAADTTTGNGEGSAPDVVQGDGPIKAEAGTPDVVVVPPDSGPMQDGGPCKNNTTSCGSPGMCRDCTNSPNGSMCVNGACGCNGSPDCPSPNACQGDHVCGSGCGTGKLPCNGGCCNGNACVAFDNDHCGGPMCAACGGLTPTCGAKGTCNGNCDGTGDGTCQMSCCNAGTCVTSGAKNCGDPGTSCVDCTGSDAGSSCELINGHSVCGCDGPGSAGQCPPGNACHDQQCGSGCDGMHPCNTGCCSGNQTVAMSTCVEACEGGLTCMAGYCQQ
jgi:hypothetical protein